MKLPLTVGLTGSIGSGKSSVAEIFRDLGAEVVSGDELGREVLDEDEGLRRELQARWGAQITGESGQLNRRRIGELVFADVNETKWLTERTFPGIYAKWRKFAERTPAPVLVFDAALIFEWGIENEFDLLFTVVCDEEIAIGRLQSKFKREEVRARRAAQVSDHVKISRSDVVIENNGTIEELRYKVKELWEKYVTKKPA